MTDNDTQPETQNEPSAGLRTMGLSRYVQFGFMVAAIGIFWFVDNLTNTVWAYFEEPNEKMISGLAAATGVIASLMMYRNRKIKTLADDVAHELSRVTWPTRNETRYASIVVVITSVIAAVLLGLMDAAWSALTDMIYTGSVPLG